MPSASVKRVLPLGKPSGADALAVRRRYLRQRRRITGRALTTLWVTVAAIVAWLFIVGFTGISH